MTLGVALMLSFYTVFTPAVFWGLKRLTRPAHMRRISVPVSLIERYNVSVTSDSDHVGLI